MATKLTLRMDEQLIARAKKYARRSGKSVSQLVADFFALLGQASENDKPRISPKVKSLRGLLKDSSIRTRDYKRHLEEKYL
jgi:hypothetical protein